MDLIDITLTDPERAMLVAGVNEWGGPASSTDEHAVAMGFESLDDLHGQRRRLSAALQASTPLSNFEWLRILVMTEFVFASDVLGSGLDWSFTTRITDVDAVVTLRHLQIKFNQAGAGRSAFPSKG